MLFRYLTDADAAAASFSPFHCRFLLFDFIRQLALNASNSVCHVTRHTFASDIDASAADAFRRVTLAFATLMINIF